MTAASYGEAIMHQLLSRAIREAHAWPTCRRLLGLMGRRVPCYAADISEGLNYVQ